MNQKTKKFLWLLILLPILLLVLFLKMDDNFPQDDINISVTTNTPTEKPVALPFYATYRVVNTYPHDPQAFTQGLVYYDGYLYESTGLYGQSSLRKVSLEDGQVIQKVLIPESYFAEGLTLWNDSLIQLTWREQTGFIYDLLTFELSKEFSYPGEGWGLTQDGKYLIMSNGSHILQFLDPQSLSVVRNIEVYNEQEPLIRLNELEYIKGEIYANIWQTDMIVRINPEDGTILGWVDMSGLLPEKDLKSNVDVLNGIAYDQEQDRIFVTGKLWPWLFEIKVIN